MHQTHLSGVDLNLLPLLDAVLSERHLTRAARRVGLSQPAASRALGRLRALLGDPLLVRSGRTSVLTPRAEALREPVRLALSTISQALLEPPPFDPARDRRTVRIAADDYATLVVLTPLLRTLYRKAPGLDVHVLPPLSSCVERLMRGEVDLAIAPWTDRTPATLRAEVLCEDGFVGMVHRKHPFARRAPSLKQYVEARHALIAPSGQRGGYVDAALAKLGKERRVALMSPHFLATPFIVAESDLVITLAERVARHYARLLPVAFFKPPIALPRFQTALYFHARDQQDAVLIWLGSELRALGLDREGRRTTPYKTA
jgi:DNA-binding transcriptional LysR family regulator